jgi:hypothetical protein
VLSEVLGDIEVEDVADSDLVAEAEIEILGVGDEDPTAS